MTHKTHLKLGNLWYLQCLQGKLFGYKTAELGLDRSARRVGRGYGEGQTVQMMLYLAIQSLIHQRQIYDHARSFS